MKIVSWNVNGLRSVLQKGLEAYLRNEAADLFCFQEIKALPEQVPDWKPPKGYRAFWNPAQRPGYSGTLILTRLEPLACQTGIGDTVGDAEGRLQTLEFPDFHLVNVYAPNARGDLSRLGYRVRTWDVKFRRHCRELARYKPVVFCGDLNVAHQEIDLANPRQNRRSAGFTEEERRAFSRHLKAGFVDTFRHLHPGERRYSWWSYRAGARERDVGWRIDYCCLSESFLERLDGAFIRQEVLGSDHCPVGIRIRD